MFQRYLGNLKRLHGKYWVMILSGAARWTGWIVWLINAEPLVTSLTRLWVPANSMHAFPVVTWSRWKSIQAIRMVAKAALYGFKHLINLFFLLPWPHLMLYCVSVQLYDAAANEPHGKDQQTKRVSCHLQ